MTFTVSHSKIKTWRRCHAAFDYKYNQNLQPRRKGRPLVFGSIIHEMIEANANGDEPENVVKKYRKDAKKLFSAEVDEYTKIIDEAHLLMTHYFEYYKKSNLKFVSIRKKLAEHEFEVPLVKGVNLKGKIDAFMRDKEDRIWLVEHKSHKEIPNEDVRFRDLQTVTYSHPEVLKAMNLKRLDGVLWDYVRSKPPSIPDLLKSGELSKARIDTFQSIYKAAIKKNKLNEDDYKEVLKSLEGSEKNFFKRIYMPLNSSMAKKLTEDTVQTALEIVERSGFDKTRNITKDCSWCSYEPLCRAELTGMDSDYIRKKEFVVEESKDVKKESD